MTEIYRGLTAKDALDLWAKNRKTYAAKQQAGVALTPDEQHDLDGNMTDLAAQNPAAWKLLKVGANYRVDPNDSGEHVRDTFNAGTGEWETKQTKGYWDHPESWMQLAFGGAMGGLGAAAAMGAVGGSAATAGSSLPAGLSMYGGLASEGVYGLGAGLAPSAAAIAPAAVAPAAGGLASLASKTSLANTGIGVAGNLVGGIIQTRAAQKAADAQADAARYAAELQDAANKRTEQFLREQAENQFANSEASRRGNYDQWRAREGRLSTLSATLGAGARQIPDYVPGVDPRYTSSTTTQSSEGPGGITGDLEKNSPIIGPDGKPVQPKSTTQVEPGGAGPVDGTAASISAYFKSRGVPDTETSYWVSKWPELVARGKEINDPNYAMKRLAAADIFGGGGGAPAQQQSNNNLGTGYQQYQYAPLVNGPMTARLDGSVPDPAQSHLQMPGSLASLAQQQKWFY